MKKSSIEEDHLREVIDALHDIGARVIPVSDRAKAVGDKMGKSGRE